ncbi:hypothetical protein Q8A73_024523 [Channa argus]|nr:hypothetical protein Q8A73_024523 [Channa argus]
MAKRPSDRRSPGRNPGPQSAFEVSMINNPRALHPTKRKPPREGKGQSGVGDIEPPASPRRRESELGTRRRAEGEPGRSRRSRAWVLGSERWGRVRERPGMTPATLRRRAASVKSVGPRSRPRDAPCARRGSRGTQSAPARNEAQEKERRLSTPEPTRKGNRAEAREAQATERDRAVRRVGERGPPRHPGTKVPRARARRQGSR